LNQESPQPPSMQWTKDLVERHYDKILVLGGVIFFVLMSLWSHHLNADDLSGTCMDLAKQFAAAFLTLIAATGLGKKNGSSNT